MQQPISGDQVPRSAAPLRTRSAAHHCRSPETSHRDRHRGRQPGSPDDQNKNRRRLLERQPRGRTNAERQRGRPGKNRHSTGGDTPRETRRRHGWQEHRQADRQQRPGRSRWHPGDWDPRQWSAAEGDSEWLQNTDRPDPKGRHPAGHRRHVAGRSNSGKAPVRAKLQSEQHKGTARKAQRAARCESQNSGRPTVFLFAQTPDTEAVQASQGGHARQ